MTHPLRGSSDVFTNVEGGGAEAVKRGRELLAWRCKITDSGIPNSPIWRRIYASTAHSAHVGRADSTSSNHQGRTIMQGQDPGGLIRRTANPVDSLYHPLFLSIRSREICRGFVRNRYVAHYRCDRILGENSSWWARRDPCSGQKKALTCILSC